MDGQAFDGTDWSEHTNSTTLHQDETAAATNEAAEESNEQADSSVFGEARRSFNATNDTVRGLHTLNLAAIHPLVLVALLLVSWLHLFYHLSHRGANLILQVLCLILTDEQLIPEDDRVGTLSTALSTLGIQDSFFVLPMCQHCGQIIPHTSSKSTKCPGCSADMFASTKQLPVESPDRLRPVLKYPYKPLIVQLMELLARKGIEDELERWRSRERRPGEYVDMMDGEVWKTLKAVDGTPFFDNAATRSYSDELRIGLTFSMDGYVNFVSNLTDKLKDLRCTLGSVITPVVMRPAIRRTSFRFVLQISRLT